MNKETIEKCKQFAKGKIGFEKRKYWNPEGKWPTDFDDKEQNPWGRPMDLYCPTIGGQGVIWNGVIGYTLKEEALDAAEKFKQKCIESLENLDSNKNEQTSRSSKSIN